MTSDNKKPIIALGPNPAWQKTLFFKNLKLGEVNRAYDLNCYASGKGVNFCRAATIWDKHPVKLMQFAGGETGRVLCRELQKERFECITVEVCHATRTCSTCLCHATQEMTELIEPSHPVSHNEMEEFHNHLRHEVRNSAGVAFCGTLPTSSNIDIYRKAAEIVKKAGIPLLVDSWQDINPVLEVGGRILFKVNADEIKTVTGQNDTVAAIKQALSQYPLEAVAITDGPGNAYFATGSKMFTYKLPVLKEIVSPLGAGDTNASIFFCEYLNHSTPQEAFARGLATASANCLNAVCGCFELDIAERLFQDIIISESSL
ncbi:MAG: hypothetical protein GY750_10745 [Lentisphaerae bacterium]|nr:hypothetical protein [Lentisphaerota bacterium]MCP4101888.1 hypothetical protein [Lentisphaerota bacterium]